MIQVFDTHRLSYKNAVLRAWSDDTKTTAINFYDQPNVETAAESIGDRIRTNERGYIFRANGTQPVHSLMLQTDAIIEVSLDNGNSWPIQWTIHDMFKNVMNTLISNFKTLTFHTQGGGTDVYDPLDNNKELPEYAFKSDFVQGEWGEEQQYASDNEAITLSDWTHYIVLGSGASDITINGKLRDGQYVLIRALVNCAIHFRGRDFSLVAGHTYILFFINTLIDITYTTDDHIVSVINDIARKPVTYSFIQNNSNFQVDQTCTPANTTATPDGDSATLVFQSTSSSSATITLKIPNPSALGDRGLLIMMSRTDTSTGSPIYLQVGNATRVQIGSWTVGASEHKTYARLSTYLSLGNVKTNAITMGNTVLDIQVAS